MRSRTGTRVRAVGLHELQLAPCAAPFPTLKPSLTDLLVPVGGASETQVEYRGILYDGYGTESCACITRCVDEQREMNDRLTIYNLNGHAITIKTG